MRKIYKTNLTNTSKEIKQPSIPDSYGHLYMYPGKNSYEIPYDDEWGLSGSEKVNQLTKDNPYVKEDTFLCRVMDNESVLSSKQVEDGDSWNPETPTKEGHTFIGFYKEKTFNTKVEVPIENIRQATDIFAKFDVKKFNVTFNADGGSPVPPTQSVAWGSKASKPSNPTKEGHDFVKWVVESTDQDYNFETAVKAPVALKAIYKIKVYTVTFNPDGGTPTPDAQKVNHGSQAKAPVAVTKEDNTFIEWQANGTKYDFTKPVKSNLTLTAKWNPAAAASVINEESGANKALTREYLETLNEDELKVIADEQKVEGFRRYTRKDSLINAIMTTVK